MTIFLKQYYISIILLILQTPVMAQLGKSWPSPADYPYKLHGTVKSWTMKGENGVIRRQLFAKNGTLLKDEGERSFGKSMSPFSKAKGVKESLEQSYDIKDTMLIADKKIKYNERMQVVEKHNGAYDIINLFDKKGNILMSKTQPVHSQIKDGQSPSFAGASLTLFKYNDFGSLIDFQFYSSSPSSNFRIAYIKNSSDNLIERLSFDNLNIHYKPDDYIKNIIDTAKDNSFDINSIYPQYWGGSAPMKETYKNDSLDRKIEYICHCLRINNVPFPSFKVTWEYDKKGQITTEYQYKRYDYYGEEYKLYSTILYDDKANIVEEKISYGNKEFIYTYEIEYYK